jgi:hypothetical protein
MKSIVRIALVVALCFLNGCGYGAAPLPTLTGTWVFTLTPANSPDVIQATASLTQLWNNEVFGQVTLTGSGTSCGAIAEMSGSVNGDALSLELTQSPGTITLKGTATAAVTVNASGTYTATTGRCLQNGGAGTWTAFLSGDNSSSLDEKRR